MNHIRAFYTLPDTPASCPTFLNKVGNIALHPFIYLATGHIEDIISEKEHTYSVIKTLKRDPLLAELIYLLLFIPSFLIGTFIKGISYIDNNVRLQHKSFKDLHENAQKLKIA